MRRCGWLEILRLAVVVVAVFCAGSSRAEAATKPNVILLVTDDQGYGDLSAHGNPVLKTPNMDTLHGQSVRFTDFHVAPMCTPTRGQMMTGMDAMRNGATAVCQGRSMMRGELPTMANYFSDAGYATGLFGKWHLGDSYPHRPQDRGFQEVLRHKAWGITSLADYWQNEYFDPTLSRNGVNTKYEGYCTDIFFAEAMKWVAHCQADDKPFFLYLPTNTPHVPDVVAEQYSQPYRGEHEGRKLPSEFFGMIANLDENLGKLEAFLAKNNLRDNTIFIFMTDNGTQSELAMELYNAGMRDMKTSVFEGGHRVPLFVRWIDGKLQHGTDIDELTQVQDLLPTLIELCDLKESELSLDGESLAGLLSGKQTQLDDRMLVSQYRVGGEKWEPAVVMWNKWRLLPDNRLYNLTQDPHQDNNVAAEYPDIAEKMSQHYDTWYEQVKAKFDSIRYITVGSDRAPSVMLYASDWQGSYCDNRGGLFKATGKGYWDIIVDEPGEYAFELRRWPEESNLALAAGIFKDRERDRTARPIAGAELRAGEHDQQMQTDPDDTVARFTATLEQGKTKLSGNFMDQDGKHLTGAMYLKVTRK